MKSRIARWWKGSPRRTSSALKARLALEQAEARDVPATLLALDDGNQLLRFDSATPTTVQSTTAITGLVGGELVVGIDFRPRTGQLYALAVNGNGAGALARLYTLDARTAAATQVGAGTIAVTPDANANYGFDFNPTVDAIRVVNNADMNIRLNPNNGAILGTDTTLTPAGQNVFGVAYDRNFDGRLGAMGTTLYALNATNGMLETIGGVNQNPSPNSGAITDVNFLNMGIDTATRGGFDIQSNGTGGQGPAFAVFDGDIGPDAAYALYTIDLSNGNLTTVGLVGDGTTVLTGLAVVPDSTVGVGVTTTASDSTAQLVPQVAGAADAARPGFPLTPFPGFKGIVTTAVGDVNRDSIPDLVAAADVNGHVKVFSGADGSLLYSFLAFEGFNGSISVAAGDVGGGMNGAADGYADLIVGAGINGHVKVFSGRDGSQIASFLAFQGYVGPISVAASDLDLERMNFRDEIVVGAGINGHVKAFNADGTLFNNVSFFAFNGFTGPVSLAGGDVTGDGTGDIVVGASADNGNIRVFTGAAGNAQQLSFLPNQGGGVSVGSADVNQDGRADILATLLGGPDGDVSAFDGLTGLPLDGFTAAGATLAARVSGGRA